jgi:hypothetical protein
MQDLCHSACTERIDKLFRSMRNQWIPLHFGDWASGEALACQ